MQKLQQVILGRELDFEESNERRRFDLQIGDLQLAINLAYLRSYLGLMRLGSCLLSLLIFLISLFSLSIAALFVSVSALIISGGFAICHIFFINEKYADYVPWFLLQIFEHGLLLFLYIIASLISLISFIGFGGIGGVLFFLCFMQVFLYAPPLFYSLQTFRWLNHEPLGESRAEPPGESRSEPRGESRAKPPGDSRAKPPGESRRVAQHASPTDLYRSSDAGYEALEDNGDISQLGASPFMQPERNHPTHPLRDNIPPSAPQLVIQTPAFGKVKLGRHQRNPPLAD